MAEILLPDTGLIVAWVEFVDSLDDLHVWSMQALTDPATYYGGFKEPRVVEMGQLVRALSDINGTYQGADFSLVLSDNDRVIRAMLAGASTKFFINRNLIVRMIDDISRRQGKQPRTVMRGLVADYRPTPNLQFQMGVQDVITRRFSSQVASISQVPKRNIQLEDFPECPPESLYKPVPIIYGLVSDQNEYTTVVTGPKFIWDAAMSAAHTGGAGTWALKYVVTLVGDEAAKPPWAPENQQDERIIGTLEVPDGVGPDQFVHKVRFTTISWDQPLGYATKIYGRFSESRVNEEGEPDTLAYEGGTFGYLGYIPKITEGPPSSRVGWQESWLTSSKDDFQPPTNNMYVDGTYAPGNTVTVDNAKGVIRPIYVGPKRFL